MSKANPSRGNAAHRSSLLTCELPHLPLIRVNNFSRGLIFKTRLFKTPDRIQHNLLPAFPFPSLIC